MNRYPIEHGDVSREGRPLVLAEALAIASLGPGYHWAGGRALVDSTPRVAVIGTREPSRESLGAIARVSGSLAQRGAVVVSGAAVGTDMAAHTGALEAGGVTIACVPCGLATIDPRRWRRAFREAETGKWLLLSPFSPDQPTTRQTPVIRNRLVAALAEAVVVGEAGLKSGTHTCLNFARRLGVPVFFLSGGVETDVRLALAHQTLEKGGARRFHLAESGDDRLAAEIIMAADAFRQRLSREKKRQLSLIDDP